MPDVMPFTTPDGEGAVQETGGEVSQSRLRQSATLLQGLGGLFKTSHDLHTEPELLESDKFDGLDLHNTSQQGHQTSQDNMPFRKPVTSLPRAQTFQRQKSEQRERLLEVPPDRTERRSTSNDRRLDLDGSTHPSLSSPPPPPPPLPNQPSTEQTDSNDLSNSHGDATARDQASLDLSQNSPESAIGNQVDSPDGDVSGDVVSQVDEETDHPSESDVDPMREECDRRWILNISMRFRDDSNREKFFVTYAETPSQWRRLTISLDYRQALPGSLEADLKTLIWHRDKNLRIYKAIRDSLPEVEFYKTVTNLKLETAPEDNQLHLHVREDANEIIRFPPIGRFSYVRTRRVRESELEFLSHFSGFVYKVRLDGVVLVKKEIPGPDSVDEFIYEVNALNSLLDSSHVGKLEGLVVDESGANVKGLLITFASQGSLGDLLYDLQDTPELAWHRREKWAKQIVHGLADIHDAGFVQGDFTLSNIVVDEHDNAKIIDINRRGCPVGWEPPELKPLIESGQRISMCISVKTDLYQLGMVLWAISEEIDDPQLVASHLRKPRPTLPSYFRRMIDMCQSERPQHRTSARSLLRMFPSAAARSPSPATTRSRHHIQDFKPPSPDETIPHRADKEYIDPQLAITLDDLAAERNSSGTRHVALNSLAPRFRPEQVSYGAGDIVEEGRTGGGESHVALSNQGSSYRFGSSGSWVVGQRGRSLRKRHRNSTYNGEPASSTTSLSRDCSPVGRAKRYESVGSGSMADWGTCEPRRGRRTTSPTRQLGDLTVHDGPELPNGKRALRELEDDVDDDSADGQGEETLTSGLMHKDSGFDEHMAEAITGPADYNED